MDRRKQIQNYILNILSIDSENCIQVFWKKDNLWKFNSGCYFIVNHFPKLWEILTGSFGSDIILNLKHCCIYIQVSNNMVKNIEFKSQSELEDYASQNNKVLVVFDNYVLDATTFAKHHPGGAGLILNYQSKDITSEMQSHFPLSLTMANTMVIGTFQKQIKRMIDPDQALLPQIWNMDHQTYLKVIDSPHWLFVNSPRMFQMDFFQRFSHNKWYHIFPLPIILITYIFSITSFANANFLYLFTVLLIGIFSFSLCEYCLHRFIFHSERYLFDNKIIRYLHFILHGIHHMLPVDPDRIVYPPILALFTMITGYFTVCYVLTFENPQVKAFYWTGFMIGYFIYDLTHYSLHHIDTSKSKGTYFHKLQRYHNQHHFGGEEAGFGVSSKFWDIIFRTQMSKKAQH